MGLTCAGRDLSSWIDDVNVDSGRDWDDGVGDLEDECDGRLLIALDALAGVGDRGGRTQARPRGLERPRGEQAPPTSDASAMAALASTIVPGLVKLRPRRGGKQRGVSTANVWADAVEALPFDVRLYC